MKKCGNYVKRLHSQVENDDGDDHENVLYSYTDDGIFSFPVWKTLPHLQLDFSHLLSLITFHLRSFPLLPLIFFNLTLLATSIIDYVCKK